ncbi:MULTISPECIES: hypothetical protein [Cupriavidus]
MTTKTEDRTGAGARMRARAGAAALAALLCAGCASGPDWWRPPRPKAGTAATDGLAVRGAGAPAAARDAGPHGDGDAPGGCWRAAL